MNVEKSRLLYEMIREVRDINKRNGFSLIIPGDWEDNYKIPTVLALIHSEVSEALEAFRHNDKENFKEEEQLLKYHLSMLEQLYYVINSENYWKSTPRGIGFLNNAIMGG